MKIRAIRLREVGCFAEPTALEGLTGGLDLLAGRNELGKSTIVKALRLLLFAKHTTTAKEAKDLRPRAGGAPLIEADFEIDGRTWRLRKQFLSGKLAVLTDLEAETVVARGEDAHRQALALLRGKTAGNARFALLWVGQQESLKDVEPEAEEQTALRALVETELQSVADGGHARAVRDGVTSLLAEQFTDNSITAKSYRVKTNSPFDAAIRKRDAIANDLEQARRQALDAASRLDRLQELRARELVLGAAEARQQRGESVAQAEAALKGAQMAKERCRTAASVRENCQGKQEAATKALADFDTQLAELAQLQQAQSEAAPILKDLQSRLQVIDEAAAETKRRTGALRAELKTARAGLKQAAQAEKRRDARARQKALKKTLAKARGAEELVKAATAALEDNKATRGLVEAARREAEAILKIEAQLSAALPKVSIALAEGGAGRISVDGKAVGDGAVFEPDGRLALDIEGIGTITVAPGGLEQLEDMRGDINAHKQELSAKLTAMAVTDCAAAEKKLEARRDIEGRIAEARTRLGALAPDGLKAIEDEERQLQLQSQGDDPAGLEPCESLERQIVELELSGAKTDQDLETQRGEADGTRQDVVMAKAQFENGRQRFKVLTAGLPEECRRSPMRTALVDARDAAERAVNAAGRDLQDWQEKAGSETDHEAREARLNDAKAAAATADNELRRIQLEMKTIEGALEAYAEDGVETRARELADKLAHGEAEVCRWQSEAASLQLLKEILEESEKETRDRFLTPVLQRAAPYFDLVLPGAVLQMGDGLKVTGLLRNAETQPLSILSDGTREQIAVLVRLGFGRLLAETGAPAPLILDDALVYSDDERLARAFEALKLAAAYHQVIVLTCRTGSFERLGGERLELTPWTVEPS